MCTMQRWLPVLAAFFYCNTVFAQIDVDIAIHGVSAELETNIRLLLGIEQQKSHDLLSEGRLRRLHNKAPQEIATALQPYGYYRPEIKSTITQSGPEQWQVTYTIDPGPPVPVTEFAFIVRGALNQDPEFKDLVETLPLRVGDPFNHVKYENIKNHLARLAAERGYFRARFIEHKVEIDLDTYQARVSIHYDSGPRYIYGEIFLKQDVIDPSLLQRYIPFERGDPFDLDELIDLQQALNDSDYFRIVEVSPGQVQEDTNEVPVNVELTPRKRHRFSLGLGYGTDTGARAKFGWDIPRYNSAGHRINTEVKVSQIGYSMGVSYSVPVFNPRTDQLVYSAGIVNEETDTSESTIQTVGVSLNHSRNQWRESVSLNFQQEKFIIADDEGDSTLLIPGVNWSRTWGDSFIQTIDGLRFDLNLRGASDKVISDTNFFQAHGGLKGIISLGSDNRLIARGRLGSTWTDTFNELPTSVRFLTGGAQTVRGYAYQSLGPVDSSGRVVGGKHLMIGSIEYEHKIKGKWSAAVFYDAGNAIDDFADKLERGAGFGVRWQSPIGPVRVDLASATSQPGRPWRLHINIGPDL